MSQRTSICSTSRVVQAIESATSSTERERAIGFARLQASLVRRHVLVDGLSESERAAAWRALHEAEARAGHPLPESWRHWQAGAPALITCIESALAMIERNAA